VLHLHQLIGEGYTCIPIHLPCSVRQARQNRQQTYKRATMRVPMSCRVEAGGCVVRPSKARGHGVAVVLALITTTPLPGGVERFFDAWNWAPRRSWAPCQHPRRAALIVPMDGVPERAAPRIAIAQLGRSPEHRERWRKPTALSTFVARPVQLLTVVLFLSLARRPLELSLTVSRVLDVLEQILLIIAITWTTLRVVEFFEAIARSQALRLDKAILLPLLPVLRKTLKIFVATFAGVAVLHSFGVNVITVLAGLGVGGIAVALAAQRRWKTSSAVSHSTPTKRCGWGNSVASEGQSVPSRR
jgi:hypothetical protein